MQGTRLPGKPKKTLSLNCFFSPNFSFSRDHLPTQIRLARDTLKLRLGAMRGSKLARKSRSNSTSERTNFRTMNTSSARLRGAYELSDSEYKESR
jgi:hypothetical protein